MGGAKIMYKLYKDTQGNIYAVSPIQTPKKEWVALTKEETEAHLNPATNNRATRSHCTR